MFDFNNDDMQELKSIIRTGKVSNVDSANMTARVKLEEYNIVTGDLKIINNTPEGLTPWKPKIGQYVVCIFIPRGDGDGFILGGI